MRVTSPSFRPRPGPKAGEAAAPPTRPASVPRHYRARRSYWRMAASGLRRCLAVVALGAAVWAVAAWGVAPLLHPPSSDGARQRTAKAPKTTPVAVSAIGGLLPGTASTDWAAFRHLRIGILDGSGASRSAAALDELARLDLRRGPVRPVGKLPTRDLVVYARGHGRDARIVANLLGVQTRARVAWHGTRLPPTPLVYVLGTR